MEVQSENAIVECKATWNCGMQSNMESWYIVGNCCLIWLNVANSENGYIAIFMSTIGATLVLASYSVSMDFCRNRERDHFVATWSSICSRKMHT